MIMPEARIAPPPAARQASRLAFDAYGLEVTAQVLPGEYDDNFQLFAPDSRVFVLKIMHPAREESFVDMQCRALSHLAERVPHLTLPRVVPNLRGELFARQKLGESNERLVWLLTF